MTAEHPTYLDYNATAPLKPAVAQAMAEVLKLPLNASSVHSYGRRAKQIVEDARRKLAERLNCWPQEIIWCASASEANNALLAQFMNIPHRLRGGIKGGAENAQMLPLTSPPQAGGIILVSSIEHSSVLKAANASELIPVTRDGVVDLEWLQTRLEQPNKPALLSVMFANNETGVIQPIKKIARLAHKYDVLMHTDAVQAVGKMPMDFSSLDVDYMTLGFHKCGAPQGVGALIVANGKPFAPFIKGGGQEYNRRAGTENIAALAGLSAWLDLPNDYAQMQQLRAWLDEMESTLMMSNHPPRLRGGIKAGEISAIAVDAPPACGGGVIVVGASSPRLPNTSCIILPYQSQEITLMQTDLAGIAISAGSACSSGRIEPSHVLTAMGYSSEEAGRAIRISGGWDTKREDIEAITRHLLYKSASPKVA